VPRSSRHPSAHTALSKARLSARSPPPNAPILPLNGNPAKNRHHHRHFFITTITYDRRRIFQVPANAELFLKTLQHYRTEGAYKLRAFAVMPDHVHLLLTPNAKTISQVMNLINGGFSHRLPSSFPIWQRGFADHLILNADHFRSRRLYIHQNPVRANLATAPQSLPLLLNPPPSNARMNK
jgi:putative transposase